MVVKENSYYLHTVTFFAACNIPCLDSGSNNCNISKIFENSIELKSELLFYVAIRNLAGTWPRVIENQRKYFDKSKSKTNARKSYISLIQKVLLF